MIFIKTKFGIFSIKDVTVELEKEKEVKGILIYDESDEEICEVPYYSVSDIVKNSNIIEKILKRYYNQVK